MIDKMAEALREIREYNGGADSALEDEYVMERLDQALAAYDNRKDGEVVSGLDEWRYEPITQVVLQNDESGGGFYICQIRGWGYYTGKGYAALGLPEDEAIKRQNAVGERIARLPELERQVAALEAEVDAANKRVSELEGSSYRCEGPNAIEHF